MTIYLLFFLFTLCSFLWTIDLVPHLVGVLLTWLWVWPYFFGCTIEPPLSLAIVFSISLVLIAPQPSALSCFQDRDLIIGILFWALADDRRPLPDDGCF